MKPIKLTYIQQTHFWELMCLLYTADNDRFEMSSWDNCAVGLIRKSNYFIACNSGKKINWIDSVHDILGISSSKFDQLFRNRSLYDLSLRDYTHKLETWLRASEKLSNRK